MSNYPVLNIKPMGFQWPVSNPFIFCAHHHDKYPRGNGEMGPDASLKGRNIGQDFDPSLDWRMYHGEKVPGFPVHPHRGFETVTIVTQGMVDHSDSHAQAGRYGGGDVQWMTAGAGLQHSEMFPLLKTDDENTLELFQVWLNLPASQKMAEPHFKMLWAEEIPLVKTIDSNNKSVEVTIIAGKYKDTEALAPAPDSWAAVPENEVNIWIIRMEAGAEWTLPKAVGLVNRWLYFFSGETLKIETFTLSSKHAAEVDAMIDVKLTAGDSGCQLVMLQGRPINETVVQYGPFVMNTQNEIRQAFYDYQQTEFGGWPWARRDMVHPADKGRFARYRDGREEIRDK
jgi:quercetin 2,3-dioxygenase